MRPLTSRALVGHLPALLVPAAATLVMLSVHLPQATWPAYGSVYLCAVALVTAISGWRDAVFALVLSALLLDYFFVGPQDSLSLPTNDDWTVIVAFLTSSTLVALAIEWRRASEKRLRIGMRLAQAQTDLAEARALAGFREGSGEAMFESGEGLTPGSDEWAATLIEQIAQTLDRSAEAMERIAAAAPDESADAIRARAVEVETLAGDLRATMSGDASPGDSLSGLDAPAFSQ